MGFEKMLPYSISTVLLPLLVMKFYYKETLGKPHLHHALWIMCVVVNTLSGIAHMVNYAAIHADQGGGQVQMTALSVMFEQELGSVTILNAVVPALLTGLRLDVPLSAKLTRNASLLIFSGFFGYAAFRHFTKGSAHEQVPAH